jgi:hypothetical protein
MVPRGFPLKPMNTDNMHKIVASNQRCTTRILICYYPAQSCRSTPRFHLGEGHDDNIVSSQYDRAKFSSLLCICYIRCFLQQQIEVLIEPLQFPPQLLSTSQSHKNKFSKAFLQDFGGHFAHMCFLTPLKLDLDKDRLSYLGFFQR